MTPIDVATRLGAAALLGAAIGLNRTFRNKPAGIKTLAMVALGGGFAPVLILSFGSMGLDAYSRVIQGVLTGVGFLGAGVIMRDRSSGEVEGLTTAASIWVVAGVGLACGFGLFLPALLATGLTLAVLVLGRWIERWLPPDRTADMRRSD